MLPEISLPLSAGYVLAGLFTCDPQAVPLITLDFQNNPVRIDNSKSSAALAELRQRSASPGYDGEFAVVDGITDSNFAFKYDMDFESVSRPVLRDACIRVKAVNLTISYTATVYVASQIPPGSCRHALTSEHEMRHVNTDITALKEFLPSVRKIVEAAVMSEAVTGHIPQAQVESAQASLSKKLTAVLGEATGALRRARALRQQQVDSREEYQRLSTACPDEPRQ